VLNIGFAIAAIGLVVLSGIPWPSLILVAVSKWRTFFVRPYFLWLSIRANLVDIIANVSFVLLAYLNVTNYIVLLAVVTLYVLWTSIIKPRNDLIFAKLQAGIALFFGIIVAVQFLYDLPSVVLIATASVIAYVAARHFLIALDNEAGSIELPALCFAFAIATLTYISHFWQVAYHIGDVIIPQFAVTTLLIALFFSLYLEYLQGGNKIERSEVILAGVSAGLIQIVMLVSFSGGITH